MPGGYTHITMVRLLTAGNALKKMGLHKDARKALLKFSHFCQIGAISPDYPYLTIYGGGKTAAEHWANSMHHKYTTSTVANILHVGIEYIKTIQGEKQLKCLAWLMGYASHVTADVTCHPVTNLLVGDYEAGNKTAHRDSEMHQDAYIFNKKFGQDVRKAEHIKNVFQLCVDINGNIDSDIKEIWQHMLYTTFPSIHNKYEINIDEWHQKFKLFLDGFAEELSFFLPLRHCHLTGKGIAYPAPEKIDHQKYINQLQTPDGEKHYDQIFDYAMSNVEKVWKWISDGIFEGIDIYKEKIQIWNLDTGQAVKTPKIMWESTL